MEEPRYFYSVDGTDVQGPVDLATLKQLFSAGAINAGTHLCPEGTQEWQQLNVDFFASETAPAEVPEAAPITTVRTAESMPARATEPEGTWAESRRWHSGQVLGVSIGVLAGALFNHFDPVVAHHSVSYEIGGFLGHCIFLLGVPLIFSLAFFGRLRRFRPWVFCGGVILISLLVCLGILANVEGQIRINDATKSATEAMTHDALKQIKAKGFFTADPDENLRQPQKIRNVIGNGGSSAERMSRDFLDVNQQLFEKVKEAGAVAKLCNFDIVSLKGGDDINARQQAIEALRDKQNAVVDLLQRVDSVARAILAKDGFSETAINPAIESFHQGAHIEKLIAIWQGQAKLSADHIARFQFMKENASNWTYKDGKATFADQALLDQFNNLTDRILGDIKVIGELQTQAIQDQASP